MRSRRKLMTWDRVPGWICDWHIAGWFDSGLQHNPAPNLFGQKNSTRWTEDHLAKWGGVAKLQDVPKNTSELAAPFVLYPLTLSPILELKRAPAEFPDWETRLKDINSDLWDKLYYAFALVDSPEEGDAVLHFSGWDGGRLWINGELKFEEHSYHHIIPDMERCDFKLRKGLNAILFQLDRDGVTARIELPGREAEQEKLRGIAVGTPPEPRKVSHFTMLAHYAKSMKIKRPFKGSTKEDLAKWQKSFGSHYLRCLGPAPMRPKKLPEPHKVSEVQIEGAVRKRYHLSCEGGGEIPAYVFLPEAGRGNGRTLVIAHGHENPERCAGIVKPTGPVMTKTRRTENYAEQMAQQGFVVGLIHERNFGERRDNWDGDDPCNNSGLRALAMGHTLPRLHIADLHLLFDFLCTFPEVDPQRIGLGGLSGGGSLSYITGAFDQRFKAVSVFCGMTRYEDYALGHGCGMQVVPGLYPTGDVGEVLALIAPRPLLVAQGRLDSTFNVIRVKSIVEDARKAYKAAAAEEKLQLEIMELAHQFDPELAGRFFTKWL